MNASLLALSLLFLSVPLVACGGKVADEGAGEEAGQAGASAAGSAGSGQAGFVAAGAGGATGGAAGSGQAGFTVGGAGGVGVGGAATGGAGGGTPPDTKITNDLCMMGCAKDTATLMQLGCLPDSCASDCPQTVTLINSLNCGGVYLALVNCATSLPLSSYTCDPKGGVNLKEGFCKAEDMAVNACFGAGP